MKQLDLVPQCERCGGTGWIQPTTYAQSVPLRCPCRLTDKQKQELREVAELKRLRERLGDLP